jgi:hypothetical protein
MIEFMSNIRFREYSKTGTVCWQMLSFETVTKIRFRNDEGRMSLWIDETQMFFNMTKTAAVTVEFEVEMTHGEHHRFMKKKVAKSLTRKVEAARISELASLPKTVKEQPKAE